MTLHQAKISNPANDVTKTTTMKESLKIIKDVHKEQIKQSLSWSGMIWKLAILVLLLFVGMDLSKMYDSHTLALQIGQNVTSLSGQIASAESKIAELEALLVQSALFHTTQFNPDKRIALLRALSNPENGYEARAEKVLAVNSSDDRSLGLIRNDFMTGFLSARPEASPKQETLANLFDALDDSVKEKFLKERQKEALETKEIETFGAAQRDLKLALWTIFAIAILLIARPRI